MYVSPCARRFGGGQNCAGFTEIKLWIFVIYSRTARFFQKISAKQKILDTYFMEKQGAFLANLYQSENYSKYPLHIKIIYFKI